MSVEGVLLILRVAAGLVLLGFLAAVFAVVWRDYRATACAVEQEHRQRGRLIVIRSGAGVSIHAEGATTSGPAGTTPPAKGGDLVGASFPLLPLTRLGRAPTNTIVLNDTFCSQEHALVTRRGRQWWLEDLRSSNGTRLNGEPINEPVVVSSGDVIGIGRVELKVDLE